MKICPSCGERTEDDSQDFCVRCGAYFSAPTGRPEGDVALPSDPVDRGRVLLDSWRFREGVAAYREALASGRSLDDREYAAMLDSMTVCLLNTVIQPDEYRGAGMVQLARMLGDRDVLADAMGRLAGSLGICSIQNGVLGLANVYFLLFIDTFAVRTDARAMRDAAARARDDMRSMVDRASVLADAMPGKGPRPMEWLETYTDLAEDILGAVEDIISSSTPERLDVLASEWAQSPRLGYIAPLDNTYVLSCRATASGRLSSRMLRSAASKQLASFSKLYAAGP